MRVTHRVALELEVEDANDPEAAEPEDWDLPHLANALRAGVARPLRTIRGLVIDPEHDRLSGTLSAVADDVEETVQLHWLATAQAWHDLAPILRARRPSLELLVELEQMSDLARRLAGRLRREGL
jgi:hypothetical protein